MKERIEERKEVRLVIPSSPNDDRMVEVSCDSEGRIVSVEDGERTRNDEKSIDDVDWPTYRPED